MADEIVLHIVTLDRRLTPAEGIRVAEVRAPGAFGEFGALAGHANYLCALKPGEVRALDGAGKAIERVAITGGFALVEEGAVTILADAAERAGEIDVERAGRARERAEAGLKDTAWGSVEFAQAQAALDRALARLKVAGGGP